MTAAWEFAALPPGRYRVERVEACAVCDAGDEFVSPDTESRILTGRADVAAGRTVPWSEVDAGLRAHHRRAHPAMKSDAVEFTTSARPWRRSRARTHAQFLGPVP